MPSFAALFELVGGIASSRRDALNRGRYVRKAGIIGVSSKDPDAPDVDAVHAAAALISVMWPGTQLDVAERTRALWHLPWTAVQRHQETATGTLKQAPARVPPITRPSRFGPEIVGLIGIEAESPGTIAERVRLVTVWRDHLLAAISERKLTNYFGEPTGPREDEARLQTQTTAPAAVLRELGAFVRRSRQEAAKRGITIDVIGAYRALGDEPPQHQPSLEFSEPAPASAKPEESERAASRPPAENGPRFHGQPATKVPAPASQGEPTLPKSRRAMAESRNLLADRSSSKGDRDVSYIRHMPAA